MILPENLKEYALECAENYFSKEEIQTLSHLEYCWNRRFRGRTAGVCRFKNDIQTKKTIPVQIDISARYIEEFPEMFIPILLHEMIHAVLPYEEKHGAKFKEQANRINMSLKEKEIPLISVKIPREKMLLKEYRYVYQCTECGQMYRRVQKPIQISRYRCGKCKGKLKKMDSSL